jgi:hypothetical protein
MPGPDLSLVQTCRRLAGPVGLLPWSAYHLLLLLLLALVLLVHQCHLLHQKLLLLLLALPWLWVSAAGWVWVCSSLLRTP